MKSNKISKKQFDLHLHTNFSDGRESPKKVLSRAKKAGLSLVSITDHNSITHIEEEIEFARSLKLNTLPGVELSAIYQNRHLHLLGYGFKKTKALQSTLKQVQQKRKAGVLKIAAKLRHFGFEIEDKELTDLPTEYLGLAHIIRILLQKPAEKIRILKEAGSADIFAIINHYFSQAKEAYVPEDYLPAVRMIKLIRAQGGFVSLAHPGSHLGYHEDYIVHQLAACGLEAIEVFTPKHNWDQIIHYEMLAKKLNLVITAGSNYHEDFHQQDIPVVTPIGFLKTPARIFDDFMKFAKKKNYPIA